MARPRDAGHMGIYRLYCEAPPHSFVGFSWDLVSTRKRLLFELKMNACPYTSLQACYNAHGGLQYECLEEYVPGPEESDLEIDGHLTALLLKHKVLLQAELIQSKV